jgi:hypothetical protein
LHLLPTLEIYGETHLNAKQRAALAEELRSVRDLVDEAALRPHLDECLGIALECGRSPRQAEFVIEGP